MRSSWRWRSWVQHGTALVHAMQAPAGFGSVLSPSVSTLPSRPLQRQVAPWPSWSGAARRGCSSRGGGSGSSSCQAEGAASSFSAPPGEGPSQALKPLPWQVDKARLAAAREAAEAARLGRDYAKVAATEGGAQAIRVRVARSQSSGQALKLGAWPPAQQPPGSSARRLGPGPSPGPSSGAQPTDTALHGSDGALDGQEARAAGGAGAGGSPLQLPPSLLAARPSSLPLAGPAASSAGPPAMLLPVVHASSMAASATSSSSSSSAADLLLGEPPHDVFIVDTLQAAKAALQVLEQARQKPYRRALLPPKRPPGRGLASSPPGQQGGHHEEVQRVFACDTETAWLDLARETPTGHGAVICFSVYGGEDVCFGQHPVSGTRQSRLWVDVLPAIKLNPATGQPVMDKGQVVLHPPESCEASAVLQLFGTAFFASPSFPKVWHNYGFDRHVLANMGITCQGFAGDTLQMARLLDASRRGKKNYGLESLSCDKDIMRVLADGLDKEEQAALRARLKGKTPMKTLFGVRNTRADGSEGKLVSLPELQALQVDPSARPSWIDYSALDAKATWELREALARHLAAKPWCPDPYLTRQWQQPAAAGGQPSQANGRQQQAKAAAAAGFQPEVNVSGSSDGPVLGSLARFYDHNWRPFGQLLTDMEAAGMKVDREHLRQAQAAAEADRRAAIDTFIRWATSRVPDATHMNVASGSQIRQLLFPDYPGKVGKAGGPAGSGGKAALLEVEDFEIEEGGGGGAAAAKAPGSSKAAKAALGPGCRLFKVPNPQYEAASLAAAAQQPVGGDSQQKTTKKKAGAPKKFLDIVLYGVWGSGVPGRLAPEVLTATGAAAVSLSVLRGLAGRPGAARKALAALDAQQEQDVPPSILPDAIDDALAGGDEGEEDDGGEEVVVRPAIPPASSVAPPAAELEAEAKEKGLGRMYVAMGGGRQGLEACVAVEALCEVNAIDKLLSAFILPLQGNDIATAHDARVHCSLNINTETGRLSARRPNLQNQPALEKDRYKVRRAFTADTAAGHTLLVADYGQLELRLLAHITNCASMLRAFELGGDFHSRTALGMYDYIAQAVEAGEVLLEWDGGPGRQEAPKPLLKDKYAAERRKAKVLNFSIAYGKTAFGLARDFGTSEAEARATVERWYSDRQEVKRWQEATIKSAERTGEVRTLLGRSRPLRPDINSTDSRARAHAGRAAINTPIQGSAADVATAAMLAIHNCPRLREMGWRLLMQVHDEVILEGPASSAAEAKALVVAHMRNPWAHLMPAGAQPLRVELAVDAKVADTWYDAK